MEWNGIENIGLEEDRGRKKHKGGDRNEGAKF